MDEQTRLQFHAAPPPGHWLNDPNGLVYADGAYRLFAQHRSDPPAFRATGWARFTSPDLLHWSFDGPVLPPDGDRWMYSGCVLAGETGLEAVHTLHSGGLERQVRRSSADAGRNWTEAEGLPTLGAPAANRRDPFVFRDGTGWALLLSEPCDWTAWPEQPPSRLILNRSDDGRAWRRAGVIGPWSPPGVMWEVPLLARVDGYDVLFVSTVDRREDRSEGSVLAWIGELRSDGFQLDPRCAPEGLPVDLGPDFYALMVSTPEGWPHARPAFVAWASSWRTARRMPWPAFHGGPISLPRDLSVELRNGRLRVATRPFCDFQTTFAREAPHPPWSGYGSAVVSAAQPFRLHLEGGGASVLLEGTPESGVLRVERLADAPFAWCREYDALLGGSGLRTIRLFLDGPLLEVFFIEEGLSVTAALPVTGEARRARLEVNGRDLPIRWTLAGR